MKTTYIIIGAAAAAGIGFYLWRRSQAATAAPKPTIVSAIGNFISQIGAATSSSTSTSTTTTKTAYNDAARADAGGLDITSMLGTEAAA